ncbi:MAG: hypothetical protein HRT93_09275 [Piscirickettsiaceae bacterium]|nr:hypothetical protein [Piscirickettsiaceae bacterium]
MKKHIITSLISIALFSSSASVLAEKGGKTKGHGVGGISEEHMSDMGAEHNKSNAGDKARSIEEDTNEVKTKKDKDKNELSHEMKGEKSKEAKLDRDTMKQETESGEKKKKWWQFFGDE